MLGVCTSEDGRGAATEREDSIGFCGEGCEMDIFVDEISRITATEREEFRESPNLWKHPVLAINCHDHTRFDVH